MASDILVIEREVGKIAECVDICPALVLLRLIINIKVVVSFIWELYGLSRVQTLNRIIITTVVCAHMASYFLPKQEPNWQMKVKPPYRGPPGHLGNEGHCCLPCLHLLL